MSYMHDNDTSHKAEALTVADFLVQHSVGMQDIVHQLLALAAGTFEVGVLGEGPSWMEGGGGGEEKKKEKDRCRTYPLDNTASL